MEMSWDKLLCPMRIRDFFEKPGQREDHRTEFEKDYDRAIFSSPVRRLHDKAQVFPLEPNDSVRTRLIHSLEVSTVSRDMGRAIGTWLKKEEHLGENEAEADDKARAIERIAATCGLIHDLGNPPFGHAGEEAISEWFSRKEKGEGFWDFKGYKGEEKQLKNDFLKFQGNAQTIRLISRLQVLCDLYGLNFTCGTMSAAFKYIAPSHKIDEEQHEKGKMGHFASENIIVNLVQHQTGTQDARNPITYLVEAADDIVYSVVDIEDGVKKGVIDWKTLKDKLFEYSLGNNKNLEFCFQKAKELIDEKDKRVSFKGRSHSEALVQAFRVYAIGVGVKAVIKEFKNRYKEIIRGQYHKELFIDSEAFSLIKACKEIGKKIIYPSANNVKLEVMARTVIHELMDIFWDGVINHHDEDKKFALKIYSLISDNYKTVFKNAHKEQPVLEEYLDILSGNLQSAKIPKNYCCMQLVTDYICGMTDGFACSLHKQLKNG